MSDLIVLKGAMRAFTTERNLGQVARFEVSASHLWARQANLAAAPAICSTSPAGRWFTERTC